MASVEDRARGGIGVDTARGEACVTGRAPHVPPPTGARWAPKYDADDAALVEAMAHQPLPTPGPRAPAGRPGATRSPDEDSGVFRGVPTRRFAPSLGAPSRPPNHPLGDVPNPNVTSGHPNCGGAPNARESETTRRRVATGPASLRLDSLGLPPGVVDRFVAGGLTSGSVYPWQRAAIDEGKDGANLVFCAPTSGGKSLVANVLLVRALQRNARAGLPGRVLVVLPFQSLVNEKVEDLKKLLTPMFRNASGDGTEKAPAVAVRGFAGNTEGAPLAKPLGPHQEVVAVTTIEKASVCVSRLVTEGRIHELCAVVVDELHVVGDRNRGATLEHALAKLRFHARKARGETICPYHENETGEPVDEIHENNNNTNKTHQDRGPSPQIIAMSATVSHDSLERLAGWLDARLFVTNFRPVPLTEFVAAGDFIFAKDGEGVTKKGNDVTVERMPPQDASTICDTSAGVLTSFGTETRPGFRVTCPTPTLLSRDALTRAEVAPHDVVAVSLAAEAAQGGFSTLMFCPSRNKTEVLALAVRRAFREGALRTVPTTTKITAARRRLKNKLVAAAEGSPSDSLMAVTEWGVGFHHAHLRAKEKEAIEEGFRTGALLVLACTTTLAAGVNLPARRVVILLGMHEVTPSSYRQMAGRAGRAGQSEIGEAFVVPCCGNGSVGADTKKRDEAFALVSAKLPATRSGLLLPSADGKEKGGVSPSETKPDCDVTRSDPCVERLAQLALQCVTSGTFRTQKDGFELLRSTFAFGVPSDRPRLSRAFDSALRRLSQDERLIETVDVPESGVREWRATRRGDALHASALPVKQASVLYDDLAHCARNGIFLEFESPASGKFGQTHLLFLCAPRFDTSRGRNPFDLKFDWAKWYDVLCNDPALRELGAKLKIQVVHAQRARVSGSGNPKHKDRFEKHKRLAAAAAIADALGSGDLFETLSRWSAVAGVALLPGMLQQLTQETASNAAMASNLAASAGWGLVATLLHKTSKELDAGAFRELAALTAVSSDSKMGWTMTVARARCLFKRGLRTPEAVAMAGESEVAVAVAEADAGSTFGIRKKQKTGDDGNTNAHASASAHAARRAAFELVEACRLHEMRRLAAVITDAQTLGPIGSWEGEDDVGVNL